MRKVRSSGIDLIVEIIGINALNVIRTQRIEISSPEIGRRLENLILAERSQLRVAHDLGSAIAMSSDHHDGKAC
jgi:hypothetical protein